MELTLASGKNERRKAVRVVVLHSCPKSHEQDIVKLELQLTFEFENLLGKPPVSI